jgi:hypothetical protein
MEQDLFSEKAEDLLTALKMSEDEADQHFAREGQAFLDAIGLQREGMRLKDVSYMTVKTVTDRQSEETSKHVGAAAHFGYELGGIPAWGPGAKTTVYFGEQGPTGLYDAMRTLEPTTEVELFDPRAVLAAYADRSRRPRSILRLHTGVVEEAIIENVQLTYYLEPGNVDQEFVEPFYLITGTMYGWNPGPDPQNPRRESTPADPAPFVWLEHAATPVPEPSAFAAFGMGLIALAHGASRRARRG